MPGRLSCEATRASPANPIVANPTRIQALLKRSTQRPSVPRLGRERLQIAAIEKVRQSLARLEVTQAGEIGQLLHVAIRLDQGKHHSLRLANRFDPPIRSTEFQGVLVTVRIRSFRDGQFLE